MFYFLENPYYLLENVTEYMHTCVYYYYTYIILPGDVKREAKAPETIFTRTFMLPAFFN